MRSGDLSRVCLSARGSALLKGQTWSDRHSDVAGPDPVCAHEAGVNIDPVQVAALAGTVVRCTRGPFRYPIAHITSFGDAVPVTAMGAGDVITLGQCGTGPYRAHRLADVGADKAEEQTLPPRVDGAQFEWPLEHE